MHPLSYSSLLISNIYTLSLHDALPIYEDFYHHTLKITEAKEAGMGHAAWRASSKDALYRKVESLERSGYGKGWIEGDLRSEEHTSELQSRGHLVCRLLLEKKNTRRMGR